ncbi:MAG TPA: hypothetical protein VI837_04505 [Blastocatellia bacterium]|nr:hypothetical protein [Blastocatellia bacterium]
MSVKVEGIAGFDNQVFAAWRTFATLREPDLMQNVFSRKDAKFRKDHRTHQ